MTPGQGPREGRPLRKTELETVQRHLELLQRVLVRLHDQSATGPRTHIWTMLKHLKEMKGKAGILNSYVHD